MQTRLRLVKNSGVAVGLSAAGLLALSSMFSLPSLAADAALVSATREGNLSALNSLIQSGADVNAAERDGTTPLLWATYESNVDVVNQLIAAGADPNATNNFGVAPLLQASRTGDSAIVEALLNGGADLPSAVRDGETPLMAAARAGNVTSVELLLKAGSDPDATEAFQGQTALMWATVEGHLEIVDALLNAGADPNIVARATELTRRKPARADFPSGGFTALMFAARNGDVAITQRLVEAGGDLTMSNPDGATPTMIAIVNDRFDYAAKLLELGADANDGSLYQAVLMRDATTDWLAKDGTQWRADHSNELTALDLTRTLLEAGADPNKPFIGQLHSTSMCCDTKENATPMFRAAVAADVAALQLLIEHGGDLEWSPTADGEGGGFGPTTAGKTPLMVAMNGGKGVGMAGGPGDIREGVAPPFREKANREPVDAVQVLLAAGANPDAVTADGDSALHMAAKDGKLDIIRALADAGATLDLANGEGKTALEIVDAMEPREPPPTTGAMAGMPQGAQPAEVAALLRELMQEGQ